jgi:4-aminobutyrate aminotransferase-like enzyme
VPPGGTASEFNPQWERLLNLLEMNVRYERGVGAELFTSDGRRIVDFLSGYCVHGVGHNHPRVVRAPRHSASRGARFAPEETAIRLQFLTRG